MVTTRMASENYGYMAPIKAALDSSLAFLAKSFSRFSQVRFNAVAPGRVITGTHPGEPEYLEEGTVDAETEYSLARTPFPSVDSRFLRGSKASSSSSAMSRVVTPASRWEESGGRGGGGSRSWRWG